MTGPPAASESQPPETVYHDGPIDRAFIWLFSRKMARAVGQRRTRPGYDGFVELSRHIMAGRNAAEQQALVAVVLRSLVPAQVLWLVRRLCSPTQLVCELNAWFAARLFQWLVGPCEVTEVEITDADGQVHHQRSGVQIQKCRYLAQSRCVGTCINLCKLPTQEFFSRDFAIPLTLTPNFEDYSCKMVFGQLPPSLEDEEVYGQPCLVNQCDSAQATARAACHQIHA
ncbi:hypothetical protein XM38_001090 [Halomicronema hongdechloris C2206]|uniref:Beta-carotene isomerase D27-like C-terminal domain-containing protein n=1 Tax=Halomicronema hongdechloris C2206 TaxID=1641165 RepID=A0A1Z3HFW3_9CYAN|nr:DUF4033 domain-containing protein [Halomicronema hongdechloris]ASC69183.1 hypothetical protein XM38_001090 [Halomicronema hongdechloris C2206]